MSHYVGTLGSTPSSGTSTLVDTRASESPAPSSTTSDVMSKAISDATGTRTSMTDFVASQTRAGTGRTLTSSMIASVRDAVARGLKLEVAVLAMLYRDLQVVKAANVTPATADRLLADIAALARTGSTDYNVNWTKVVSQLKSAMLWPGYTAAQGGTTVSTEESPAFTAQSTEPPSGKGKWMLAGVGVLGLVGLFALARRKGTR